MSPTNEITVSSHVARDFLQNADYFSTMPKVVWEYVSNALDNPKEGQPVIVDVKITPERVVFSDNASGMDREDLLRFFQMHGRNIQRQRGRVVRGRFGTGKSAAFGIARTLRIETRKDSRYNVVQLRREVIDAASHGKPFAVEEIVSNAPTDEADGTTVVISRLFNSKRLEIEETRRYIERHLGRNQQNHRVFINDHQCEFEESVYTQAHEFEASPHVVERIGPVRLVVKVAPSPLDAESNGIDVLAHGLWHDTTLGDLPRQGSARRLFGEVTCDLLETWEGEPSPFDNTRNNTLNPVNPVVATLLGWVSTRLREIVEDLDEAERSRKKTEEAKKLTREAQRLGEALNEDFRELQRQLAKIRSDQESLPVSGQTERLEDAIGPLTELADPDAAILPGEGYLPTDLQQSGPPSGDGRRGLEGAPGEEPRPGSSILPGEQPGAPHKKTRRNRSSNTFAIEFVNETAERERSHYDRETRTIYVNLDHPQLAAARSIHPDIDSDGFRQVAYEVAFVEYALALMTEEAYRDVTMDPHDVLFDVRSTVNRVAQRIPNLLSSGRPDH
jgi:hypothetical protein